MGSDAFEDRERPPRRLARLRWTTAAGHRVRLAEGLTARLLGLALLDRDRAGPGLLIPRCRSVHTLGMRFPLEVVFLDRDGAVVSRRSAVPPGRLVHERRAASVLELVRLRGAVRSGALRMSALAQTLNRVASAFEEQIDDTAATITARSREEIAEWSTLEAPEVWEAVRDMTLRARRLQAQRLRHRRELPATCPDPDVDAARLAARGQISLPSALKSYRIGHAVAWDAWLDAVESLDLDGRSRKACLRAVSRFVVAYDDRVMELFTEEYMRACEQERRNGHEHVGLIRDLIEGMVDDAPELGYDLDAEHLAVIARGRNARPTLHTLAVLLDRQLVVAGVSEQLFWGWLGARASIDAAGWRELARFEPEEGCRLAVGQPGVGLGGFRRSHRQAGEAHLVALRRSKAVTLYADVALEALALSDERVARDFMANELGTLNGVDARSHELRETLRRYLASSQNAAATAATLRVHEQTVSRRLKTIEEKIGSPLNQRHAELELALRLKELLEEPSATSDST